MEDQDQDGAVALEQSRLSTCVGMNLGCCFVRFSLASEVASPCSFSPRTPPAPGPRNTALPPATRPSRGSCRAKARARARGTPPARPCVRGARPRVAAPTPVGNVTTLPPPVCFARPPAPPRSAPRFPRTHDACGAVLPCRYAARDRIGK